MKKTVCAKLISLIIIFVVIGNMSAGCYFDHGNNASAEDTTVDTTEYSKIETDDYSIIKENGSYYIVFNDKEQAESYGDSQSATVDFESIKEFKDSVIKGLLKDWQKATILSAFPKDKTGILSCDFNNLYEPVTPGSVSGVYWSGETYAFGLKLDDNTFGVLQYLTAENYSRIYQSEYENYFNADTITVTSTELIDNGEKSITYYKTYASDLRQERYTLKDGSKTIVVDKRYVLTTIYEDLVQTSDTVPANIKIYCQDGDIYYIITLHKLIKDPSDEWLLQFGMKRYIDKNESVK